jgi:hypothetical protein
MKKLIALLAVCGFAFAFVACGKKAEDTTAQEVDTAAVEQPAPAATDTAAQPADTAATPVDSAAH